METNELVVFDPVKAEIAKYEKMNEEIIFDYEDPQDNKDARSHMYGMRKIKAQIATIHKAAKAEPLAYCKALDAKKNEYTSLLQGMIDVHAVPIKQIETREEQERQAKAAEEAEAKRAEEERRQKEIEAREGDLAKAAAELKAKEDAFRAEQNAARLEVERVEREKRIAAEAAEQARFYAEAQAEAEKQAIIDAAAKEKAEATAKVKAWEDARLAAEAEEQRLVEIEAKRVANEEHRKKIETEIEDGLFEITQDEFMAAAILIAIKNKDIPHLTITY